MSIPEPVVRIVGGGAVDDTEHAAIVAAVTRSLARQDRHHMAPSSAWRAAGRLEGVGLPTVRSRSALPRG